MTAYEWNQHYPIGTTVRYRYSVHMPDVYSDTVTTSEARKLPDGPCVRLREFAGWKSILFLEVLAKAPAESGARR